MTYMRNTLTAKTSFDFEKMSNENNNWDKSKVHPMNHEIEVISKSGDKYSLRLAQIATIIAIVDKFKSPGSAIDYLFNAIKQDDIIEICGKF